MTPDTFADALILTGPTGSGKTTLSLELAERLGAEIVSMDSMALYRRLDIATAKPTPDERARVPHHLIDVLDSWESASVAWWLGRAAVACDTIRGRGRQVLFVGGTPLYLKALLFGMFDGPAENHETRHRLEELARMQGSQVLHQRLAQVDPVTAERLHPNDVRRMVRALEVWEITGRPISDWQRQWQTGPVNGGGDRVVCLDRPREELYARIDARVVEMMRQGLLDEIAALRRSPRPISRQAAQAVGYREICAHLDGQLTLDDAVRLIQTRSRQFAKRQLTWFRQLPGLRFADERLAGTLLNPGAALS